MVQLGSLRYHSLWAYTGIIAGMIFLDKIALTAETAVIVLAPIVGLIGADYYKHKSDKA
jgi:hypothetical protein